MASGAAPERLTTTATVWLCYAIDRQKLVFFSIYDLGRTFLGSSSSFKQSGYCYTAAVTGSISGWQLLYCIHEQKSWSVCQVPCRRHHRRCRRRGLPMPETNCSHAGRRKFKCTAFQEHNLCRCAAMSFNQAGPRSKGLLKEMFFSRGSKSR